MDNRGTQNEVGFQNEVGIQLRAPGTINFVKTPGMISFVKTHPDAKLPQPADPDPLTGDAGYDLTAVEDTIIPSRERAVVPVGLTVGWIEPGYWFTIEGRSGLSFKHGVRPHRGIIDNGYRGDLGVLLYNNSDVEYFVHAGDRIAQIVIHKLHRLSTGWIEAAIPSERGANGFGSTGK